MFSAMSIQENLPRNFSIDEFVDLTCVRLLVKNTNKGDESLLQKGLKLSQSLLHYSDLKLLTGFINAALIA